MAQQTITPDAVLHFPVTIPSPASSNATMNNTLLHLKLTAAALAAAVLGTIAVSAAETPQGGGPPDQARGFRGRFNFDDQQRQLMREAMQKDREALASLTEKSRAAQKELMQAALAEKFDEKAVRSKAEALAKLQTEITVLRAKALSTVAPTLKPEQREQLENTPIGAAMLSSGFMDFGGRPDRAGDPNRPRGDRAPGGTPQ
jgi:Spy/CpxP family protein refolding chaperone